MLELWQGAQLNFSWTITLGNVLTVSALGVAARVAIKLHGTMLIFMAEHDLLIQDYCERRGIQRGEVSQLAMLLVHEKTKRRGNGAANGGVV